MSDDKRVAVLGAACTVGQVGSQLRRVRRPRRREALADADLSWPDVQFVSGADTIRNGYPGFIAGATFAQASLDRCQGGELVRGVRIGRVGHRNARAQILAGLCDVALVVGRTPRPRLLRAGRRRAPRRPGLAALPLLGATNPTTSPSTPAAHGPLRRHRRDFAQVKVKNSRHGAANPNARYATWSPRAGAGLADGGRPAAPPRDLRHLDGGRPRAVLDGVRRRHAGAELP